MPTIRLEREDRVAVLTIDNPRRRNAFSEDMNHQLERAFDAVEADPQVRAVVLTGEGDQAFSSGHDLRRMFADRQLAFDEKENACFTRPLTMEKAVIAAINGFAYAGGLMLVLASDLRLATPHARFAATGARLGLVPIGGQIVRLGRLLPATVALKMLLTAEPLAAEDAYRHGFVLDVLPHERLLPAAKDLADRIAALSPSAVRAIKRVFHTSLAAEVQDGLRLEIEAARVAAGSADAQEGLQAFLEKRRPAFD